MPGPPILIVVDHADPARLADTRLLVTGDDARIEGDPPIRVLGWPDLDRDLSGMTEPSAIVFEAGAELLSREGFVAVLRQAWPDIPILCFDPAGAVASAGPGLTREFHDVAGPAGLPDMGLPIGMPISAGNLRMLVHREARLLTLGRRHRAAVAHLREQTEKLDLLLDTIRSADGRQEPAELASLLVGRFADLLGAETWRLTLVRDEGEGPHVQTLPGVDSRSFETLSGPDLDATLSLLGLARHSATMPECPSEGAHVSGTTLIVPLVSRGRTIGLVELFTSRDEPEARFGSRELELARALEDPLAFLVGNSLEIQHLEEQSVTDELTGLANSRFLKTSLGREIKRARRHGHPLSVIFIDLDGFKVVNDAHGHLAGSRMLAELGRVLAESMRETDIVARYGGDEFTIVMPHTGAEDARIISGRLQQKIEGRLFLEADGLAARITASFGISCYPAHGETGEELIAAADRAMYRVKERGKNGVEMADSPAVVRCT